MTVNLIESYMLFERSSRLIATQRRAAPFPKDFHFHFPNGLKDLTCGIGLILSSLMTLYFPNLEFSSSVARTIRTLGALSEGQSQDGGSAFVPALENLKEFHEWRKFAHNVEVEYIWL